MPHGSPAAEFESAIVVAATHPESHAARVEAHQRQEHYIEPASAEQRRAFGFLDPQPVAPLPACQFHEPHLPTPYVTVDTRHIDPATAAARECNERCGIQVGREGCVYGDAQA